MHKLNMEVAESEEMLEAANMEMPTITLFNPATFHRGHRAHSEESDVKHSETEAPSSESQTTTSGESTTAPAGESAEKQTTTVESSDIKPDSTATSVQSVTDNSNGKDQSKEGEKVYSEKVGTTDSEKATPETSSKAINSETTVAS